MGNADGEPGIVPAPGRPVRRALVRTLLVRGLAAIALMALLLFAPAGTVRYWQAWLFLASLLVPAALVVVHYLRTDPEVLERRMRTRERERPQRRLILWAGLPLFLLTFVLPGLDLRFGWSAVPAALVIASDALVVAGYLLFARVLRENRFASRVVEVVEGQRLITTGPYAAVRHPMYVSTLAIYLPSPLALGSYWGLLASIWFVPLLVARIHNEEEVLRRDLPGYEAYARRTRYRLVPFVW